MEAKKIFIDFTNEPKISKIKEQARKVVTDDILEYLKTRYDVVRQVGTDEVGFVVGIGKDTDGFTSDIVVTLKATAKTWYDKQCAKHNLEKYDLEEAGDAYELKIKAKGIPKK